MMDASEARAATIEGEARCAMTAMVEMRALVSEACTRGETQILLGKCSRSLELMLRDRGYDVEHVDAHLPSERFVRVSW